MSTKVSYIWKDPASAGEYRTGISLHGHTQYSKEKLHFIPVFTQKWPVLQRAMDRKCKQSNVPVDFSRSYWTPPLTPKLAFDVERKQIENVLGLASLVSLTDHDSIEAPIILRQAEETAEVPLSLEWSVPFGETVFHLGIHNLPSEQAQEIFADLEAYTEKSSDRTVTELLARLHELPDVLIVFNHPMWNMYGFGFEQQTQHVERFLEKNNPFIHAFELNGMRRWEENKKIVPLAERWKQPLISGGDRHGCEPNANVNLSNARSFVEFVHEIRDEQRSHVLFMEQYTDPMIVRVIRSVLDVIRYYPEHPVESRSWDDRVFHPDHTGAGYQSLSALWGQPPAYIRRAFSLFRVAENAHVHWALTHVSETPSHAMDSLALSEGASDGLL